jgi:peptidoglycan/LPS O-acetylase OafA/YrhL
MFFALAGFLIAGSAERLTTPQYFINRWLRIFPALIAETILCALLLGPLFTTLPFDQYFLHAETRTYFLNVFGWVQFTLPGVFESNPHAGVNWSLWTVPYELKCYLIGAMLVILLRRRCAWLIVAIAVAWFMVTAALVEFKADSAPVAFLRQHVLTGEAIGLYCSFILGYAAYGLRDRIPYSANLAILLLVALLLVAVTGFGQPFIAPFVWIAAAYLTLFVGVSKVPRMPLLGRGDYSYGIYLYGIPVQQAVRATFPDIQNSFTYLVLVIAILLPLAMLSWHCVERPVLGLRKRFSFIVRSRGISTDVHSAVGAPPPVVDADTGRPLSFGAEPMCDQHGWPLAPAGGKACPD